MMFVKKTLSNLELPPGISQFGFQLINVLIAISILGILSAIAYPSYTRYIDKVNNEKATSYVVTITQAIERYQVQRDSLPDSLEDINMENYLDPWGRQFQYLRIEGAGNSIIGQLRKDKSLVPVNTDYDLYSKGKDGRSAAPFTAQQSRDDIVRANNGRFIGLAVDY